MHGATPHATYRVQLMPGFTLDDAQALVPYLRDLGVSHLYTSPIFQARAGSTHGYDVVDHHRVNEELGGAAAFDALVAALHAAGMHLLIDVVPNHMAVMTPGNRWWEDVLQNGRASRYADFFDIDWDPPERKLSNRVLVPVLHDHYGRVLEAGDLRVERQDDRLHLRYADQSYPLDPRSLAPIVQRLATELRSPAIELLAQHLWNLPTATDDAAAIEQRRADVPRLVRLLAESIRKAPVAAALDRQLAALSSDIDALDDLIRQQHYRLAYWRVGRHELDYRRFFDIDSLVGLRTERKEVFEEVHERVFAWAEQGAIDGVRIDHVDGLRDPLAHLCHLRERLPHAWILVEKIVEEGEALRDTWPIDGTTGYEFAATVNGLFVDPASEGVLTELVDRFEPLPDFADTVRSAKLQVMSQVLDAEIARLTASLAAVCEHHRRFRDFARAQLDDVVREMLAAFDVYRTYVDRRGTPSMEDLAVIERAAATLREARPDIDEDLVDLLRRLLRAEPELRGPLEEEVRDRFQQTSGAVMAKSKEDTAFYRAPRLLSLNEVGADPGTFGIAPDEVHRRFEETQRLWPATMLALSTHDTKRSEDVRARLNVLTELPTEWVDVALDWQRQMATSKPDTVDGATELYLYETLIGAHPLPRERCQEHLRKAIREAKVHTSWLDPDEAYEAAVAAFIDAVYDDEQLQASLDAFVRRLLLPARVNSLAQKLVQLTAPGVPDLYQGQELWDLSLADPDNRRPVDHPRRRDVLAAVRNDAQASFDLTDPDDVGAAKLRVIERALAVRRHRPDCFGTTGTYEPVDARGAGADHVFAFTRGAQVLTVVPRLTAALEHGWTNTSVPLPPGTWRDAFDHDRTFHHEVALAELLAPFPVALLVLVGDDAPAEAQLADHAGAGLARELAIAVAEPPRPDAALTDVGGATEGTVPA